MKRFPVFVRLFFISLTVFSSISIAFSQISTKYTIHVVGFNDDKPIEGVNVSILDILGSFSTQSEVTNANGDATFTLIKDGIYVAVAKDAFSDATKAVIYVSYETLREQTKTIHLKHLRDASNFDQKFVDITV